LIDPLIAVRAVHFAATASTAGGLAFLMLVARPACAATCAATMQAEPFGPHRRLAWIGLVVVLLSGIAWVALEVAAMSGLPLGEAVQEGMIPVVVTQTQFGIVALVRLAIMALLAASLAFGERARWMALACAAALLGSLAWTGHAAGTIGALGPLHLIGDALHCLAAGAWVGALVPLALTLAAVRRHDDPQWLMIADRVTRRFSTLGMASVATLIVTGLFNAWILVGSLGALIATEYGRLLQVKLALFALMLGLAAVNRLHWTPRLAQAAGPLARARQDQALRQVMRNSAVEAGLGLAIFVIVGALGTIHPAIHLVPG
jgi:putative copper resistance protein D